MLLALFAGLGIFGVQQAYLENQRKAVIGEVRQIGVALSFAKQDLDFFPRLCFLNMSLKSLQNVSYQVNHVHYMGFDSNQIASRILADWNGAYYANSLTRKNISQGRKGGICQMYLPDLTPATGADPVNPRVIDWPADTYGNPYVLYLCKNVMDGTQYVPNFITDPWEDADRFTAVVSYGRNRVPGGALDLKSPSPNQWTARLYTDNTTLPGTYIALVPDQTIYGFYYSYNIRARAISYKYYPGAANTDIWITDNGSDDIIYEF